MALRQPGHVICVASTGSGKSLIFETFAKTTSARTLLISPLTALARQQSASLTRQGTRNWLDVGRHHQLPESMESGVWITSPEALTFSFRQRVMREWKPAFLVVDECHCLWDWGERFRPAFRGLPELLVQSSLERSLWLTATLPPAARSALMTLLPDPVREIGTFAISPRLQLLVTRTPWTDRLETLARWVQMNPAAGIIFVFTREMSERIARVLNEMGRPAVAYHAGLSTEERLTIEKNTTRDPSCVIVATSAFGMGMHYPHFRWVVLYQMPFSLLALTQAIGRVSRKAETDGRALILWDDDDARILEWGLVNSDRSQNELREVRDFLSAYACRKKLLKKYFNAASSPFDSETNCANCDYCLEVHP